MCICSNQYNNTTNFYPYFNHVFAQQQGFGCKKGGLATLFSFGCDR